MPPFPLVPQINEKRSTLWSRLLGKGRTQRQAIAEVLALPLENPSRLLVLQLLATWRRVIAKQSPSSHYLATAMGYDLWNAMLHRYVNQQGLVDYRAWQAERETLSNWLGEITAIDPTQLEADQALAFWINLYNALVIEQVLARYPIDSIRPTILGLPNWLGFLRFFQRPVCQINSRSYSLNDIEHGTLRRLFSEPRIHFALVCAAKGCPLLRPEAYWPEQVQQQLEADAQRFITNNGKVRYEPPMLYCSKIFQWYGGDFVKAAGSVSAYIQRYLPINRLDQLQVGYLDYDWGLNQQSTQQFT